MIHDEREDKKSYHDKRLTGNGTEETGNMYMIRNFPFRLEWKKVHHIWSMVGLLLSENRYKLLIAQIISSN